MTGHIFILNGKEFKVNDGVSLLTPLEALKISQELSIHKELQNLKHGEFYFESIYPGCTKIISYF
ncbi:MAG: hypothetical protein K0R18_294 [Bacillales bacterium]|nr:hypothetical protein [Bacillales bacterium]